MTEKFEIKIDDDGKLIVDLGVWLENLPDEHRQALAKDYYWSAGLLQGLVDALTHEYAADSYNGTIHKARQLLITSENMPEVLRHWADGMLSDVKYADQRARYYQEYYFSLWHYLSKEHYEVLKNAPREPKMEYSTTPREVTEKVYAELEAMGLKWPEPEPEASPSTPPGGTAADGKG
jgi:hypothetical protein